MSMDVEEVAVRTGSSADWASADAPILAAGELGVDLTTLQAKVGDGTSAFAALKGLTPRHVDVVLVAGTKTTADTAIKATSRIVPVVQALGTVTTVKPMLVTRSNGVSFTITSSDATDTSTVRVLIWD